MKVRRCDFIISFKP